MPGTRAIFFWMGGVLTQAIEPLLRSALIACGQPETNLYPVPGFAELAEKLTLGSIDVKDFYQAICDLSKARISHQEFQEAVVASLTPTPRLIQTITQLPANYSRWLIVDYPRSWFELASEQLQIEIGFLANHLIFLQDSRLPRLIPDVFNYLSEYAKVPFPECLVVDAISRRAVAALDHDFPAAIFVDASRLEREFVLRGFTAKVPLEHRPATVSRGSNIK